MAQQAVQPGEADLEARLAELAPETEQLRAELTESRRLEAQRRYQAQLLATVQDAIIATDERMVITTWNPAAASIYGWSAGEVVGRPVAEVLQTRFDQTDRAAALGQALTEGEYRGEVQHRHRDGRWIPIESTVKPMRDDHGRLLGFVAVHRDISQRKQAEAALAAQSARAQLLADVSQGLAEAGLDYQGVLKTVARRTAELIGDACVIALFSGDAQHLLPTAFHHPDPRALRLMNETLSGAWQGGADTPYFRALRAGETVLIPAVTPEQIRKSLAPEFRPYLDQVGIAGLLLVPLRAQDHVIGTLGLTRDRPGRPYTADDQRLLEDLAARASLAIQNARLFRAVDEQRERLRVLGARLAEAHETERRQIARELHDEIGQVLTALQVRLEMSRRLTDGAAQAGIVEARRLVAQLMEQVQDLSLDLRPPMLDDLGLVPALLWHFERYTSQTGVQVRFAHEGADRAYGPQVETVAYRVIQEALTNVARHACVDEVKVRLWGSKAALGVQIEDRGAGFDVQAALRAAASGGLSGMRERVALLGGELLIESASGAGTQITLELPLACAARQAEGRR